MKLGDHEIGLGQRPFIIAEMSGNHNHSLARALELVDVAAAAGAHALKIQTYTADTMTLNLAEGHFLIKDQKSLWADKSLYELYKEAYTPWEWHAPIFERCRKQGIIGFSTPFDETAIDFLEGLNVPFYKIASFENTDIPLIRKVATTGKPMIISTGLATDVELEESVRAARTSGCRDLILLKCTSTYPASPEASNLRTIPAIRERFGVEAGLSDHTMGIGASVAAVVLGATVIEKHLTLSRKDGGVDSAFSLEPAELESLVIETERAWLALGEVTFGATAQEKPSIQFRRSLYITRDLRAGEILSRDNLRAIRPGLGLPPKYLDELMGQKVKRDVKRGTPMSWDLVGKREPPAAPNE